MQPLPRRILPRPSSRWVPASVALAWLLIASGFFTQAPAAPSNGKDAPVFEEWVVVVIDGKPCGYGSTITTKIGSPDQPQYLTEHHEEFTMKRTIGTSGASLKMTETSKITEDADGGVLNFSQVTDQGSKIELSGVRDGEEMVVTSRGQTQRFKLPRLSALGPEAIRRQTEAVPLKPGQTFSFKTFTSLYPQAVVLQTGSVVGQETRNVRGVDRKLWKLTSEVSMMPGFVVTSWVDDKSNNVEEITVIPGVGTMHGYVTNRAECLQNQQGTEIFAASLIHPLEALPSPADQGQATYRLNSVDLNKKLTFWNKDEQIVLSSEPGTTELEVTVPRYVAADATWQLPHADTPDLHRYLQSSTYLEVQTPEIQSLAHEAVGDEKNPVLAAHKIEKFVQKYITKKDLKIGFASAQQTAKSREGDCTEHAVLCAALGRAVGLPTRCVVGFGYIAPGDEEPTVTTAVDKDTGIFAFHMWAEAWIGPDEWVPMDAALDGFDVGHIAITKTALDEVNPLIDLDAPVRQMLDSLKIEVVKTVAKKDMPPRPPSAVINTPSVTPAPVSRTSPAPSAPETPSPTPSSKPPQID